MRRSVVLRLLAIACVAFVCAVLLVEGLAGASSRRAGDDAALAAAPRQPADKDGGGIRFEWAVLGLLGVGGLVIALRPKRRRIAPASDAGSR
jgi:hypothetical protein